jgi:hypothetical protein
MNDPVNSDPQVYTVARYATCTADELFNQMRQPGISAPGAPYAQDGFNPDIRLTGDNTITQTVDPAKREITNATQEGHRYHPGTVEIRVTDISDPVVPNIRSKVEIVGTGTTPRYYENTALGYVAFSAASFVATLRCDNLQ